MNRFGEHKLRSGKKIVVIGALGVVGKALTRYLDVFDNNVIGNDTKNDPNAEASLRSCLGNEDMIFVCVPTPQNGDGSIDLSMVEKVTHEIGRISQDKKHSPFVVYKSTMVPGSTSRMKEIMLTYGIKPRVAYNPEFLRQKHAFADTMSPSRIVVGSDCGNDAEDVIDVYEGTEAPKFIFESFEEAELVKYYANCYYAARISFFNQMKQYADHFNADHDAIVKTVVVDQSVGNHGSNPTGVPYGNACLPKDLNAIIKMGENMGIYNKFLRSVKNVNDLMINKELYKVNLKRWI